MAASRGSRHVDRLPNLSGSMRQKLLASSVCTCADLLSRADVQLVCDLDVHLADIRRLLAATAAAVAPRARTALDLLEGSAVYQCLRTGIPELDAHLLGGIRSGVVTELVGPAGIGKTQLCVALAAEALLAGRTCGAGVIYVDTERSFPPERLLVLLEQALAREDNSGSGGGGSGDATRLRAEALAARLLLLQPSTWEAYTDCLLSLRLRLLESPSQLLVVDSIAAPARAHHFGGARWQLQADLIRLSLTPFPPYVTPHFSETPPSSLTQFDN